MTWHKHCDYYALRDENGSTRALMWWDGCWIALIETGHGNWCELRSTNKSALKAEAKRMAKR